MAELRVTRREDDRIVVRYGSVVIDIGPGSDEGGIEAVVVEVYAFDGTKATTERLDWTKGRTGPLEPGQVQTFRAVPR